MRFKKNSAVKCSEIKDDCCFVDEAVEKWVSSYTGRRPFLALLKIFAPPTPYVQFSPSCFIVLYNTCHQLA